MKELETAINHLYPLETLPQTKKSQVAIHEAVRLLDQGKLRVCTSTTDGWVVHEWIKKAILLYFRITKPQIMRAGALGFFDKLPLKKWRAKDGVRVVPHAIARYGSFVSRGAILMPSYVNIGAFVGEDTMVDTWATVGSCAQIGARVHLSGGVGVGGVLEPLQAKPVVIEDDAFIGSRCILVEGVQIGARAVLAAGVVITASTKIIDVTKPTPTIYQSVVPPESVVIPGTALKSFAAGEYGVPCALIIGKRTARTDAKTALTAALRS